MSNIFFRKLAADRWPDVPITGAGPFALCSCDAAGVVKSVYLTDELTARAGAHGIEHPLVVSLKPCPEAPHCHDRFPD